MLPASVCEIPLFGFVLALSVTTCDLIPSQEGIRFPTHQSRPHLHVTQFILIRLPHHAEPSGNPIGRASDLLHPASHIWIDPRGTVQTYEVTIRKDRTMNDFKRDFRTVLEPEDSASLPLQLSANPKHHRLHKATRAHQALVRRREDHTTIPRVRRITKHCHEQYRRFPHTRPITLPPLLTLQELPLYLCRRQWYPHRIVTRPHKRRTILPPLLLQLVRIHKTMSNFLWITTNHLQETLLVCHGATLTHFSRKLPLCTTPTRL